MIGNIVQLVGCYPVAVGAKERSTIVEWTWVMMREIILE